MATTLLDLIKETAELFGHLHVGTAEAGSNTTTIVDTTLIDPDDFWNNHYVYVDGADGAAPEGEERFVSDFVQSTGTLTISPAFTAAVAADDTYLILPVRRGVFVRAINNAIRKASERFGVPTSDAATITIAADTYQYNLPADLLWLEDVKYRSDSDEPYKQIGRTIWGVSGTPGAQVLELTDIDAFTAGDNLRLDYIKRLSELSDDTDALGIGVPAEAELIEYITHRVLWYLHTQAANRGISSGTFREHLTQARNASEAAAQALEQAPSWQRTGRWHLPERPQIRG